jgi:hypothetical protein
MYPFIDTKTLRRSHFNMGRSLEAKLRQELPSPLYWIQPERKILWNLRLLRDYLLRSNTSDPQHQVLVEQYLKSLNSDQIAA